MLWVGYQPWAQQGQQGGPLGAEQDLQQGVGQASERWANHANLQDYKRMINTVPRQSNA
jgi:hypothetical protein